MKKGFTLAEVLITLGIIGVVAALILSTLIQNYQKKVMATRLKQAYSILSSAIKLSETTQGAPLSNEILLTGVYLYSNDTVGWFKTNIVPYMQGVTFVNIRDISWFSKTPNGTRRSYFAFGEKGAYCLSNGMCFYFINHTGAYAYIGVDLNGPAKPNRVGHDVFYFALHFDDAKGAYIDGKVYTVNSKTTLETLYDNGSCNNYNTGWDNGSACTEIIIRNNWQIPDDSRYPW
jgi:prepilin-type N-terminal cleavage/methylation domain-containing protein